MSKNIIRTAAVALAGAATIAGLGALGTGTAAAALAVLPSGCYDIWGPAVPGPSARRIWSWAGHTWTVP